MEQNHNNPKRNRIKEHLIAHRRKYLIFGGILLFIIVFSLGTITGYFYLKQKQHGLASIKNIEEKDVYVEFLSEAYDKIKENYWDKLTDEQLGNLFKLGAEKLIGTPQTLKPKDKEELKSMLTKITKDLNEEQKKEFSTKLINLILINLKPLQRSTLYTVKDRETLANRVKNINPEINLYETLGVGENASKDEIEKAHKEKIAELEPKKDESEEAKKQLEEVKYAYDVLSASEKKEKYDTLGVEPTVFAKLVRPDILHIYIKKMSPTTFDEFKKAADNFNNTDGLDTLILDLRANVGGAIDLLPYILGPFIGNDQYAYEFYFQGEHMPFKTKIGWLPSLARYKKVVILIDNQTQSSAEVMAATLKKYNVGILVGTTTKGWGTIEKVIDINQQIDPNEKYSIFLVHNLTLRDDGQPIEGNGVNPLINIDDPGWEQQLYAYFHYDELTKSVKEIWNKPPTKF